MATQVELVARFPLAQAVLRESKADQFRCTHRPFPTKYPHDRRFQQRFAPTACPTWRVRNLRRLAPQIFATANQFSMLSAAIAVPLNPLIDLVQFQVSLSLPSSREQTSKPRPNHPCSPCLAQQPHPSAPAAACEDLSLAARDWPAAGHRDLHPRSRRASSRVSGRSNLV